MKNLFIDMPKLYDKLAPLALQGSLFHHLEGMTLGFDQKSPYHNRTLFCHTCDAIKHAHTHGANNRVITALRWHDLGKLYTQSMVNIPNGTPLGEMRAHYYDHAVASRDLYELSLRPEQRNEETKYIAALILNHDRHLNRRAANRLLSEGWKSDFIQDLLLVQECDKFAHSDYAKERNMAAFVEGRTQVRDVLRTAKAMEKVRAHYDYLVAQGYEVAAIFLYGSQNYGLDYEDSDYDTKAIVVPTFESYVYSKTRISTVLITPDNEHIDVKDIRSMFDNLAKSNINFLEILFTKFRILNPRYSELLAPIFKRREEIATYDMKGMLNAVCGMSMQKLKALQHPYPSIADKIEKYGYDCYQDDTYFLTPNGWKLYDQISDDEMIGTLNPASQTLEFQRFVGRVKKNADLLYEVDTYTTNFSVTPNHKLYCSTPKNTNIWGRGYKSCNADWSLVPFETGMKRGKLKHILSFPYNPIKTDNPDFSDDFLMFLGCVCSDGTFQFSDKEHHRVKCARVSQTHNGKSEFFEEMDNISSIPLRKYEYPKETVWTSDKQTAI